MLTEVELVSIPSQSSHNLNESPTIKASFRYGRCFSYLRKERSCGFGFPSIVLGSYFGISATLIQMNMYSNPQPAFECLFEATIALSSDVFCLFFVGLGIIQVIKTCREAIQEANVEENQPLIDL